LTNGGDKNWSDSPPYQQLGKQALRNAGAGFKLGNAGAGYGALEDTLKGGVGSASSQFGSITVGSYVCVNSFGSTVIPGTDAFYAYPYEVNGEFGGRRPPSDYKIESGDWDNSAFAKLNEMTRKNTSLAVIAIDAALTHSQCQRIAVMAQDGLARAIRPIHTPFDGDIVYVMSCGQKPLTEPAPVSVSHLGAIAADLLTRSVARAVYEADTLGKHTSYCDRFSISRI